ncbi:hypothetical protein F751_6472 [Auxenochlorella protothecoides]|uniref:Uncharacterized protein n=1 Tax=Auxenochlorella protothecoides TaxID=3075 RepID=A0A087ST99_AUXPR|nr:hypothetical protein F751_6472 [Auxenochlorella protothecoides]KFM28953.1 hypothetical protein F751_6472 [Auxenochlorella protothecoides]
MKVDRFRKKQAGEEDRLLVLRTIAGPAPVPAVGTASKKCKTYLIVQTLDAPSYQRREPRSAFAGCAGLARAHAGHGSGWDAPACLVVLEGQ